MCNKNDTNDLRTLLENYQGKIFSLSDFLFFKADILSRSFPFEESKRIDGIKVYLSASSDETALNTWSVASF